MALYILKYRDPSLHLNSPELSPRGNNLKDSEGGLKIKNSKPGFFTTSNTFKKYYTIQETITFRYFFSFWRIFLKWCMPNDYYLLFFAKDWD